MHDFIILNQPTVPKCTSAGEGCMMEPITSTPNILNKFLLLNFVSKCFSTT